MTTIQCTHSGCDRTFTKPSRKSAEQALRMHVGRAHEKNILTPTGPMLRRRRGYAEAAIEAANGHGHSGVVTAVAERASRSNMTAEEQDSLVNFLRTNREHYPNKVQCFKAALEKLSLTKKIRVNGSALSRYYARAEGKEVKNYYTPRSKQNRKAYARNKSQALVTQSSTDQVTLTGSGVSVSFSVSYLPDVLHTIAFSMSGGKKARSF